MYTTLSVPRKNSTAEDKKRVLRKALIHVTKQLNIKRQELSAIIGLSESSLSRFFSNHQYYLDPSTKEGELAILLIRLHHSLDILFGNNREQCRQWIKNDNAHLGTTPIKLIQSIPGLIHAIEYLAAMNDQN